MDILCGGCGRTLTLDDGEVPRDLACPNCGRLIRTSAMEEGAPEEDARLLAPLEAEDDLADDFLTKARLALKKKLLVVCGSCGEKLTVDQRLAGGPARCPSCGKQIQVPSINEDGEYIARRASPIDLDVEAPSAGEYAGDAQAATNAAHERNPSALAERLRRLRFRFGHDAAGLCIDHAAALPVRFHVQPPALDVQPERNLLPCPGQSRVADRPLRHHPRLGRGGS